MQKTQIIAGSVAVLVIVGLLAASRIFVSVPVGHVAVATLFGEAQDRAFEEGLHFPVNPLFNWHFFDARQKTLYQEAAGPRPTRLRL